MSIETGCAQKQSQISEQIERLDKNITELSEEIKNLHDKLGPVVRSSDPVDKEKVVKDSSALTLVPLALALRVHGLKIGDLIDSIKDLYTRIEV